MTTIWLILSITLFILLIIILFRRIRPWWKKLGLLLIVFLTMLFTHFKYLIPLHPPLASSGEYSIKNAQTFYSHETKFPKMATEGTIREIPVSLWLPENTSEPAPVIIFSHGSFGVADSNGSLFNELASHGYIVASLDHPYHSFTTQLSDGRSIFVDMHFFNSVMSSQGSKDLEGTMANFKEWKDIRVEDMNYVVDSLLQDPTYGQLIDQDQVFLSGHSLGGAVALELGRQRPEDFSGVISLEAPFFGDITGIKGDEYLFVEEEYPLPVLHFYSDALWGKLDEITTYAMNQHLIDLKSPKFVNVHISGSGHIGLSELSLTSPVITDLIDGGMNTKPAYEKIAEINQATLEFLANIVD